MYKYTLTPILQVKPDKIMGYWQDIADGGLLKYRLADIKSPQVKDAAAMVMRFPTSSFVSVTRDGDIAGECTLMNFQGLCAMVHFSIHPSKHGKQAVRIAKESAEQIFSFKRRDSTPYLKALLGLTPVSNKLAIRLIKLVGYKEITVLPSACRLEYKDRYDDGLLTILEAPGG